MNGANICIIYTYEPEFMCVFYIENSQGHNDPWYKFDGPTTELQDVH